MYRYYMAFLFNIQSCTSAGSAYMDSKQWISVEEATILQYETWFCQCKNGMELDWQELLYIY